MDIKDTVELISHHYAPLSPECKLDVTRVAQLLELKKAAVLVREGQYSDKTFFIVKGCARAFYLKNGKDISDWFAFENEFISSINSFFLHTPSPHFIELMEDSVILELTRAQIDKLADTHRDFERLSKVVVVKTMLKQSERITAMQFHSAEEKYKNLLAIHPDIEQRIPLTHIASYINITLETLSRIRKRLSLI